MNCRHEGWSSSRRSGGLLCYRTVRRRHDPIRQTNHGQSDRPGQSGGCEVA